MNTKYNEFYIGGQCVARCEREVRAPLHMLMGGAGRVAVVAHRVNDGTVWYSREFKTLGAAVAFFDGLRAKYPAAISCQQYLIRQSGGRGLYPGFGTR
jgi:hypothetical protein